jgi:hypothetical protein
MRQMSTSAEPRAAGQAHTRDSGTPQDTNDESELPIVAAFEVALKIASEYPNQRISMRARDALYSAL